MENSKNKQSPELQFFLPEIQEKEQYSPRLRKVFRTSCTSLKWVSGAAEPILV